MLGGAGLLKLSALTSAATALGTFRVPAPLRRPAAVALSLVELALAAGVAAGSDRAAYGAAGLALFFAAMLGVALASGRGGQPCACFGSRSRVSHTALARNVVLAGAFFALPSLPTRALGPDGWLALALVLAFACIGGLAIAVLALAREIGTLRLQLPPESALDVASEGPPLGVRVPMLGRFDAHGAAPLALAIFSSEGCRLCQTLSPVVAAFRRDPRVAVEIFDEVEDAEVWRELRIPGSPFAVALDREGAVHAKGTFNTYGQLESILATAERRLAEAHA